MKLLKGLLVFILGGSIIGFLTFVTVAVLGSELGSEPTGGAVLGFIMLFMAVLGFFIGGTISVILFWIFKKKK